MTIRISIILLILIIADGSLAFEVPGEAGKFAAEYFEAFLNNHVRPDMPDSVASLAEPYLSCEVKQSDLSKLSKGYDIFDIVVRRTYSWPIVMHDDDRLVTGESRFNRDFGIEAPDSTGYHFKKYSEIVDRLVEMSPHFVAQERAPGYTGVWLNKGLFDRLASGVEPRVALKECGNPTAVIFSGGDELMMSWNNHEGSPMLYKVLEEGSIETLGLTPSGIKMAMKYRLSILEHEGIEILSVDSVEPRRERQDDLVRYPEIYGTCCAPQGMIVSLFLAGDYSPAGYSDSTISIYQDGSIEGLTPYNSLSVGYDCSEESSQNHVYFHLSGEPGRNSSGDSFVWERAGDTLSFYGYKWEDVPFNGTVGEERIRLIKK